MEQTSEQVWNNDTSLALPWTRNPPTSLSLSGLHLVKRREWTQDILSSTCLGPHSAAASPAQIGLVHLRTFLDDTFCPALPTIYSASPSIGQVRCLWLVKRCCESEDAGGCMSGAGMGTRNLLYPPTPKRERPAPQVETIWHLCRRATS